MVIGENNNWICPRCNVVYSSWIDKCSCHTISQIEANKDYKNNPKLLFCYACNNIYLNSHYHICKIK
jgi:hypothetical protein